MTEINISSEIDFERPGKQLGYLRLPHSVHRSAYGFLPVPIGQIVNGDGPRVLLSAGNHGDEYEGQVILSTLLRKLEPKDVQGRLTILPMLNFPAAEAGLRVSPIDEGNLNRAFVGQPLRGLTWTIAHYVETVLMPRHDLYVDLHAGGSSLFYKPSVYVSWPHDAARRKVLERLIDTLAMPCTLVVETNPKGAHSQAAAERSGLMSFAIEAAGGGQVTHKVRRLIEGNLLRALKAFDSYTGEAPATNATTRYYSVENEHFLYANEPGLFEPLAELGDLVKAGQPACLIHHPETPGREPEALAFPSDGELICMRVPARVMRGDCLFHLGGPRPGP
jgi:hypothetical protein